MSERDTCEVTYDADAGCVIMRWRDYGSTTAFRAANERVLSALREHGSSRLLGDIERLGPLPPEDQVWLTRDWIPRAVAEGLRTVALATPAFEERHAPVLLIGERIASPELRYFDELEAARAWLGGAGRT